MRCGAAAYAPPLATAFRIPFSYEAYVFVWGLRSIYGRWEEVRNRGKQPQKIDAFTRAAKQHVELFSLFFGKEHAPERLEGITTFQRIDEAEPDVSHLVFIISPWGP